MDKTSFPAAPVGNNARARLIGEGGGMVRSMDPSTSSWTEAAEKKDVGHRCKT